MTKKQIIIFFLILATAVFFRFYMIRTLPGGLFPDEAANGLDINSMQQGHLQPFYERGNGREALFFYIEWASVEAFGKGPWQHHISSATVGTIGVILCFFVTKKLFETFSDGSDEQKRRAVNLGLLAMFLMAASTWHVTLSRTAFRANTIPMFAAATMYCLLCAYTALTKGKRLVWAATAGAVFALGFYTYIAYRIMAPILLVAVGWPWLMDLVHRPRFFWTKKFFVPAVAFVIATVIFVFPIAKYFYDHPGSFVGRSDQVSIFNPDLNEGHLVGALAEVTKQSLLGFFFHGDINWRHNVSGEPFLPWYVSPFFALGLILATLRAARFFLSPRKHYGDWPYFLMAGWFWGMLLPVVTTAEGIPHGLRSIGLIPAAYILSAWGIFIVFEALGKFRALYWRWITPVKRRILTWSFNALKVCFVVTMLTQTYILYFDVALASPEQAFAFRDDLTPVANYLNGFYDNESAVPAGKIPANYPNPHTRENTFLILDDYASQTVDYLTTVDGAHPSNPKNQPYKRVKPEDIGTLTNLHAGDQVVFNQTATPEIKTFKANNPTASLVVEVRNSFDQAVMAVYQIQ